MSLKGFMRVIVVLTTVGWSSVASANLLTDLVAYWPMEETSGTRFDVVGSNDLTDNNTVTSAAGIRGNAAQFTAANEEYFSLADNADVSMGDLSFTIAAWVFQTASTGTNQIIIDKGDIGFTSSHEYILYDADGPQSFIWLVANNSDVGPLLASSFGDPPTGEWIFLVGWHDAESDTVNIQVNNGAVDSTSYAQGSWDSPHDLRIGVGHFALGTEQFWNGLIDEVGIWKRTLTAEERRSLYEEPGVLDRETPSEPVIPEPASLFLLGSGLLGLVGWRWRFFL